jgi:hypothetical protein
MSRNGICIAWLESYGIKPKKIDANGPVYDAKDVYRAYIKAFVYDGDYMTKQVKHMTKDAQIASELCDEMELKFRKSLSNFSAAQKDFSEQAKKISGDVRASSEKLAQGIQRVEKAANFERLERYVELLERAATAMTILGELEKTGKLDKIASAIR